MTYHQDCKCCGKRVSAYTLHLSRKLVLAFIMFADKRIALGRPIAKGEIGLTPQQYGNFQNLAHFGVIAQADKAGPWDFTPLGLRFLRGEVDLPTPVAHMDGKTLAEDDLAWATHVGKRERRYIRDVLPPEWKSREAYQDEKRSRVA